MKLSVVITTFNRAEVVKGNLDHFCRQTDLDFEVVVVMDGSTDHTEEILKEYKEKVPYELRWLNTGETDKFCVGKARNMGILETSGKAVVILDDDSFPVPDWVKEHKRTVRRKTLTGGYRNAFDPNDELHAKMRYFEEKIYRFADLPKKTVVENNCCMFRKDWIGCGLFTERIEGYGGVGQELSARLSFQGFVYQFNPQAMIYHHREFEGDNGLTRQIKQQQSTLSYQQLQKFDHVLLRPPMNQFTATKTVLKKFIKTTLLRV